MARFTPNGFSQRRPDGKGFTYSLDGLERRVPFMLSALKRLVKRETAYVVEGEKDMLALAALGCAATTNAQGSGWKWPNYWADFFVGAERVVVIADNDEKRRACATQRAGVIARSCPETRIIEAMPGVPEKGDVSDWIAAGGTFEQLEALVETAVVVAASEPEDVAPPASITDKSSVMEQWGALLRRLVDDGQLDGLLTFRGPWRSGGVRSVNCPFANEHEGQEIDKPSAYLKTIKGSGLGCDKQGHSRMVLGLLRDIGWADDTDAARKKLRDLKYKLPASRSLQIVTLSDVDEQEMEWLWEGRIAYNNMTLLPGDGGIGKSFVTMELAAAVTNGSRLPIDNGWQTVDRGDVLLVNFEDGIGNGIQQIIKKRARLCNARMNGLHVIAGTRDEKGKLQPFSREHVGLIADHLRATTNVRLIIIDPLMSFIGKADVFRDNEVREALAEIVDVVSKAEQKVALLIVHHNRKAAGEKGTDKVAGSVGLTNYARSVVAADYEKVYDEATGEESDGRKMLTVIKGNYFGQTSPVPFGIDEEGKFWWQPADKTLLGKNPALSRKPKGGPKLSMTGCAYNLIAKRLDDREWHDVKGLICELESQGISKSSYDTACKKLNVEKQKGGFENGWQWKLPPEPPF